MLRFCLPQVLTSTQGNELWISPEPFCLVVFQYSEVARNDRGQIGLGMGKRLEVNGGRGYLVVLETQNTPTNLFDKVRFHHTSQKDEHFEKAFLLDILKVKSSLLQKNLAGQSGSRNRVFGAVWSPHQCRNTSCMENPSNHW